MKYYFFASLAIAIIFNGTSIFASEQESCRNLRISDVGWTDNSVVTALATQILDSIGYQTKTIVLSGPTTFASLENNDLDVFLGNWIPSQRHEIKPYLDRGTIIQLHRNLSGAKYTMAVPKYVYDAGIKDFADLHKFPDKFDKKIFGINSGSQGNIFIENIIAKNDFNLGDWQLVKSSEQGMMVEVANAYANKRFIAFLGWAPHPMNINYDIEYLTGGDDYFGKNFGSAEVFTVVRKDFEKDCPNLAKFFKNLTFTPELESKMMAKVIDKKFTPKEAALATLQENPYLLENYLAQVKSFDGKEPLALAQGLLVFERTAKVGGSNKIPIGEFCASIIGVITKNFSTQFRMVSKILEETLNRAFSLAFYVHPYVLIALLAMISYLIRRSIIFSGIALVGLVLIENLGYFEHMIKSLVMVVAATVVCVVIGLPLGVLAARRPLVHKILHPILDLMQTIPTFVYLLPTLMLFGLGMVPGLISTVIFAIAAPIRLTYLGIKQVPPELTEAAASFGATDLQKLLKVEIPHAMPSILAGVTQCIMLSLSMVVVAALVGAEGLGEPVVRALNTVNIAQGIESGLSIVILAIILDRTLKTQSRTGSIEA